MLSSVESDGSVVCTVTTKEQHRLNRNDRIRILNADEDIYNNEHDVIGIVDNFQFQFKLVVLLNLVFYNGQSEKGVFHC